MIDLGYFEGAFLNESSRQIMLSRNVSENLNHAINQQVVCKSCGANNTIASGRANECNYCGSTLR